MAAIHDLLKLLKRPTEPAAIELRGPGRPKHQPPANEMPVTETEITAALQTLLMERAQAEAAIEAAGARRDQLLLVDGSDGDLLAIGQEIDTANLHLERLDRIEQELRARLVEVRAVTAETGFAEIEAEFEAALDDFFSRFRAAIDARERLVAIRQKVEAAGLQHRAGSLELPRVNFPLSREAIAEFFGNRGAPQRVNVQPRNPVYPLEITSGTVGQYNVGELVGMTADEGWKWVNLGTGRWADPLNAPPRPPSAAQGAAR